MAARQREGAARPDAATFAEPGRVGGLLFLAASLIAGVLTVVDPGYAHDDARVLAMSALGVVIGGLMVAVARRMPPWVVCGLPPFGALMLCFGMVLDRNIVIGGEVLLTWPLLAAYMLPTGVVIGTLGTILVTFPPIALWILGPGGITPSITMTVTMVITTLVLGTLRRRNRRLVEAMHRQAMTDGLTGLPNRRAFTERLQTLDPAAPVAVAIIDVDHFKRINDTAGHAAGDETLRCLGELLSRRVRDSDVAARLGGEEFVVLFPGAAGADAARAAESLCRAVREESASWPNPITVSIGVASRPALDPEPVREGGQSKAVGLVREGGQSKGVGLVREGGQSKGVGLVREGGQSKGFDGMLAAADAALYRAKAGGRDRVEMAEPGPVGRGRVTGDDREPRLVDAPTSTA